MSKAGKPVKPQLKASEKANLTTNINNVSKALKNYYATKNYDITKLKGGQIAFAAMLETMVRLIITQCTKTVGKSKSNLLEIKRESMNNSLLLNQSFKTFYVASMELYKENDVHSNVVPMTPKELNEILSGFPNVSLTEDAKNYMHFLLKKLYIDVASTCAVMCTYAKKKSLDGLCVISALNILLDKQLAEPLVAAVHTAMRLSGRDLEAKEGDDDEEETHEGADFEDGEEGTEEPEVPEKKAVKPTQKAGPTKGTTVPVTKPVKPKATTETKTTTKNSKTKPIHLSEEEEEPEAEAEEEEEEEEPPKVEKKTVKKKSVKSTK
jgi:hypothetical protein